MLAEHWGLPLWYTKRITPSSEFTFWLNWYRMPAYLRTLPIWHLMGPPPKE